MKTLDSRKRLLDGELSLLDEFSRLFKGYNILEEGIKKECEPLKGAVKEFDIIMTQVRSSFYGVVEDTRSVIEDTKLYISSLEQYSGELDNTLKAIFDRAREQEKKLMAEMEELQKKTPTYIS